MKVVPYAQGLTPPTVRQTRTPAASKASVVANLQKAMESNTITQQATSNSIGVSSQEQSTISTSEGQNSNIEQLSSETEATPKAAEEPLSSQYAILARKEKAIRADRQKFLAEKQAFEKIRDEASKTKAPAFDESKYISRDKFLEDTTGTLTELGLSYDDLTQKYLNGPSPEQLQQQSYIKKLEARLAQIEEKQQETVKTFEQRDLEAKNQTVSQLRNETKRLVESNEAFETIKETNSVNDVVELIERTFAEDGYIMSVEEAAQAVEDHLVEEAMKLTRIKKIQQKLQSANSAVTKQTDAPKQQQIKTLTNSMGTSRQLSARERAHLAFKGELK